MAVDIGATSGRVLLGRLQNKKLAIEEISRFVNAPIRLNGILYWDILALWKNIISALGYCKKQDLIIKSVGVDTWGVDFGLLGKDGNLLDNPVCYRDRRTEKIEKVLAAKIGERVLYGITGFGYDRISTLAQLVALKKSKSKFLIETSKKFLLMPDLFRYFLSGEISCELTGASRSLLLDIGNLCWSRRLRKIFELPATLFPVLIKPATIAGSLRPEVAAETGLKKVLVVAPAGHDTASAAAAIPAESKDWAFVICGSWSVLGLVSDEKIITEETFRLGFINEVGLNSILIVKNIMGLFLWENLTRSWLRDEEELDYARLISEAETAEPFKAFIDVNANIFFVPDEADTAVSKFLHLTSQPDKLVRGQITRTILEGIAFSYRQTLANLERIRKKKIEILHLVGGGCHNRLLCQMVADAVDRIVVAGPTEASAIGNLAAQMTALGYLSDYSGMRELVQKSFPTVAYHPCNPEIWEKAAQKHSEIAARFITSRLHVA